VAALAVPRFWAADIAYVPIGRGFLYLVALTDWAEAISALSRPLIQRRRRSADSEAVEQPR
jgi:hypothetical protein